MDQHKVAGSAALLWGPSSYAHAKVLMAVGLVTLPGSDNSMVAEAWGCRVALDILTLLHKHCPTGPRTVRSVGDNLPILNFCAGFSRLCRPSIQQILEVALSEVLLQGWRIDWCGVRRRFNKASDKFATRSVFSARDRFAQGHTAPQVSTHWLPGPTHGATCRALVAGVAR